MTGVNLELNGAIHKKFPNQATFARHIGWQRQRLNKIVNGEKKPSLEDVQVIAEGLDEPFMTVANFFLSKKVPR